MAAMGRMERTPFLMRTKMATGNRAMFCTATLGLIGLTPTGSAPGDSIAILEGGKVPFVLRPVLGGGAWEIIGACYMHGCMHGEMYRTDRCVDMVIV
jgi:hypothetical protein